MRVLIVVAAVVMVVCQDQIPVTKNPDRMMLSLGKAIPESYKYSSETRPNRCTCKVICATDPRCIAFSAIRDDTGKATCTFSKIAPDGMELEDKTGSIYGFKLGSLNSSVQVLEDTDGAVYFLPPETRTFEECKKFCAQVPGFHLLMMKSEWQFSRLPYFVQIAKQGYVNLRRTSDNRLEWGDGRIVTVDEKQKYVSDTNETSKTYFQLLSDKISYIDDDTSMPNRKGICQGSIHNGY
ncbi:uncharacterized protein LOC126999743 [Eriocheir sinensis]|uniref:uncharacterized protein LOC126999743 n=1 Tax=Eriocheir sinensis TaxID=95602 RepID=UPI0021C6614B|nr:uncharacterized protein LOC126999743 [Eriocheir sinensis]